MPGRSQVFGVVFVTAFLGAAGIAPLAAANATVLTPAAPATMAKEEVAVVTTPLGEIVWRFFDKEAPGHTAYVKELIGRGFYDGTTFHRVIPRFVIQGGDPNSKNDDRSDDGEGEADRRLKAEFSTTLHYRPGTVGMARDADPDSGSCQFFIALENIPRLDGRYTIFGEVISGLDVARKIAELPRDLRDNPIDRVVVKVRLAEREVPATTVSLEAGESGETVTGPTKPKPFDPKNRLWKAPAIKASHADSALMHGGVKSPRIEIVVDEDGRVLDARFPSLITPHTAALREMALRWSFVPATYGGKAQKVRLEIASDATRMGPPTGPGYPIEPTPGMMGPAAAPRVELPPGQKPPDKLPRLRLTIDESGTVVEAALQSSCGDESLDAAAVEAARKMTFAPATRTLPGRKEPEPTPVYLDVEAKFETAPAP